VFLSIFRIGSKLRSWGAASDSKMFGDGGTGGAGDVGGAGGAGGAGVAGV